MRKIRVLIVEDSQVVCELLKEIINRDARLEVAATVGTAEEALHVLARVHPDVISMDIRLPGMNGFEATRRIMAERPTPIVVVSAASEELNLTMNALRVGALTVVEKPVGMAHREYESIAGHLCTQLAIMSEVKLVRQRPSARMEAAVCGDRHSDARKSAARPPTPAHAGTNAFRMIGIVASTGGPNALVSILEGMPATFPLPILLVQHITGTFHDGFVSWLDGQCKLDVVVARDREAPTAGKVYVAPPGRHLCLGGGCLRLTLDREVERERPSGTVLFESMARSLGSRVLAVLLTGMGADGSRGMRAVYDAGGWTIAEDVTTAVVYGMPAEAVRLGGVRESLPLPRIGPRLLDLAGVRQTSR